MRVLIVDDDDFALSVLNSTLARLGYTAVEAKDGHRAMEILQSGDIRLVITDWDMPGMNGIDLCRAIRSQDLPGYVYVIMLTAREGTKQRMEGLCAGADDFLNKPLDHEELMVCLKTAERILALETRDVALFALAKLAESRDSETGDHVERVQAYTKLIAEHLSDEVKRCYGVDDEYVRLLYQTSPLHDLGKVGIPDAILLKPGSLTLDEFAVMKTHTIIGAETLDAALRRFPGARFLQIAREIAATHHERFDGSGYPNGLAGEQIPLCGRIVAVADVYDALRSRRIYKGPMSHEEAKAIIVRDQGTQFDPEVVQAFLRGEKQIVAIGAQSAESAPSMTPLRVTMPSAPPLVQSGPLACSILVAEDDPVIMDQLIDLLSVTGERIYPATNGEDALKLFYEQAPRVVVSDWVMPKMDGVELCRRIRARQEPCPTHFIMLTGHSDKARLLDAYEAGVDDFVSKPFELEVFLARVRAGIRSAKLRDELMRKANGSQALNAQLASMNSRLERLAITDEVTGLSNRRHGMSRLAEQWDVVDRHSRPLSIAMIDIDRFKQINDTYGHNAGDEVLKRLAGVLRQHTRGSDTICRVGGDEFLIIFPAQTAQEALVCAKRCLKEVDENGLSIGGKSIAATISIGVATRTRVMAQLPDLLKAADEALYRAKNAGRHAVCVADSEEVHGGEAPTPVNTAVLSVAVSSSGPVPSDLSAPPESPESPEPPESPESPEPLEAEKKPIDWAAVLQRCGGDAKFATAITQRFRNQAGAEVTKIASALAQKDADSLSRTAHSLKSMAAYMAAERATELARQIEALGRDNRLGDVSPLLESLREEIEGIIAWIVKNEMEKAGAGA